MPATDGPARPEHAHDEEVERLLVVTAHPDDVDFGTSGSVATWVAAGIEVTYCIVTDGDAGGDDRSMPRTEMARIRRAEQTAAALVVGVTDLRFLGYPDGRLVADLGLRKDLARVIRQVRPQRVVTQSPDRMWSRIYASHPDHLAAGEATVSAVYPDARNPFAHRELLDAEDLEPWTVPQLWLMGREDADVFVDTTDAIDKKIAALRSHASQMKDPEGIDVLMRGWGAMNAKQGGLGDGRLAEMFRAIDTR
ncbi:MAG: PIG-L deacetylase family protein [Acidimicrobiia bacterium]